MFSILTNRTSSIIEITMLFEHANYRSYLKSVLLEKNSKNPKFSQRAFAKYLAISPGQFNLVLQGKKHISEETALRIATCLRLEEKEADYLCNLVRLESAKSPESKQFIARKLEELHPKQSFHTLSLDTFKVISDWYHYAIMEMITLDGFKADPAWIAKRLKISKTEVELALERLERLELIKKEKNGWAKTNEFVAARSDLFNEALRKFHEQSLEKAKDSLKTLKSEEMEFGAITMSIDPQKIPEAKKRMKQFRLDMAKYLGKGKRTETYQLAMQLFKLTTGGKS